MDAPAAQQARPAFRPCVLIPTYDNPQTIGDVVARVRVHVPDVIVIDDGSGPEGREAVEALGRAGLAHVCHREQNGGKGAAVKTGFAEAQKLGFTHALQVDADGQHALDDIPELLDRARMQPEALVLGAPLYDASAPKSRRIGRQITRFWTNLETGGPVIDDPMCGFRVYPLQAVSEVHVWGNRMDFDIEIAVRLVWRGTPVLNVPTQVRYLTADAGGVSHFRLWSDNLRISWLHTRLFNTYLFRKLARTLFGWLRRSK